jgi:hypothetical protein
MVGSSSLMQSSAERTGCAWSGSIERHVRSPYELHHQQMLATN